MSDEHDIPAEDHAEDDVVEVPSRPVVTPRADLIAVGDIAELENLRTSTQASIEQMAESIRVRGMLHPVRVRPAHDSSHGKPYELVVGYRRFGAVNHLGQEHVPAIIEDCDDDEVLAEMITENREREDHTPIDEARTMQRMVEVFGWTHAKIAAHLGIDRSQVTKSLALLRLPDKVIELVEEGQLTRSHAEVIGSLDTPEAQQEVAELAARTGTRVNKLTDYVRQIKEEQDAPEDVVADHDADEPLEMLTVADVVTLPRLVLRDDLTSEQLHRGRLYMILRAANDLEMTDYLAEHHQVDDESLWEFISELTDEQVAELTDTMTVRWLTAAHRYPTFPQDLVDDLSADVTEAPREQVTLPEDFSGVTPGEFDGEDLDPSLFNGEYLEDDEF